MRKNAAGQQKQQLAPYALRQRGVNRAISEQIAGASDVTD
jgi:hypothetical protein